MLRKEASIQWVERDLRVVRGGGGEEKRLVVLPRGIGHETCESPISDSWRETFLLGREEESRGSAQRMRTLLEGEKAARLHSGKVRKDGPNGAGKRGKGSEIRERKRSALSWERERPSHPGEQEESA